jgi:hypothetical protein
MTDNKSASQTNRPEAQDQAQNREPPKDNAAEDARQAAPSTGLRLTLIRTLEPRPGEPIKYARKTIGRDDAGEWVELSNYDRVFLWRLLPGELDGLDDLKATLVEAAKDGRTAMVGGMPRVDLDLDRPQVRRSKPSDRLATLVEEASRWWILDFDEVASPPGLDAPNRLREAAAHVVGRLATALPDAGLNRAQAIVAASAKSGLKPGFIRLRLIFLLSQPLGVEDKKALALGLAAAMDVVLDESIYRPEFIVYIARPRFEGCDDPVPEADRLFLIGGRDPVPVAALASMIEAGRKVEWTIATAVRATGGDWRRLAEKIGSDGRYRHWLKSIVGLAARQGAGEEETALFVRDAAVRIGVPGDKLREHFELNEIRRMYRHFALGDARQRQEDEEFDRTTTAALDAAHARAMGEGGGKGHGEDPDDDAEPLSYDDFYSNMSDNNYIFRPTKKFWPQPGVDKALPWRREIVNKKEKFIAPHVIIDRRAPIHELSWMPGEADVLRDCLVADGGRIVKPGCHTFNLYRPPTLIPVAGDVDLWLDHLKTIYPDPDDWRDILRWLASRVQRPEVKINHALVLGGPPGIGKDTLLEPIKQAVGPWNFADVDAKRMLESQFNKYRRATILRISEAKDLGDFDRYEFYESTKTLIAAPPDVLEVNEKNIRHYYVPNVVGGIITTNHRTGALYLPRDDRRHLVFWSDKTKEDFPQQYWDDRWRWYQEENGYAIVAHNLRSYDLAGFNPKAPPRLTEAFWAMANAEIAPETHELDDMIDRLGSRGPDGAIVRPQAVTIDMVVDMALTAEGSELAAFFGDRKKRRSVMHQFELCGYRAFRNPDSEQGIWQIAGKRQVVYVRRELNNAEAHKAVGGAETGERTKGRRGFKNVQ